MIDHEAIIKWVKDEKFPEIDEIIDLFFSNALIVRYSESEICSLQRYLSINILINCFLKNKNFSDSCNFINQHARELAQGALFFPIRSVYSFRVYQSATFEFRSPRTIADSENMAIGVAVTHAHIEQIVKKCNPFDSVINGSINLNAFLDYSLTDESIQLQRVRWREILLLLVTLFSSIQKMEDVSISFGEKGDIVDHFLLFISFALGRVATLNLETEIDFLKNSFQDLLVHSPSDGDELYSDIIVAMRFVEKYGNSILSYRTHLASEDRFSWLSLRGDYIVGLAGPDGFEPFFFDDLDFKDDDDDSGNDGPHIN